VYKSLPKACYVSININIDVDENILYNINVVKGFFYHQNF
jgi:hypothetical protein